MKMPKLINFDNDLFNEIESYRVDNGYKTFTGALFDLIRIGLNAIKGGE